MKAAIREILQYVVEHPEMTTRTAVESYFDQILWSIEKREWMELTEQEKQRFADQVDLQNVRLPEGYGEGDNKPTK